MEPLLPGKATVGFVGIGKMGTPMTRNLRRGGYTVVGYDLRKEAVEALHGEGVQAAESLAGLAARADVVITMLPDSNAVEAAVLGPGGLAAHLAAGKLIIDMSSSFPPRTKALAGKLQEEGITLLGAPVSGGVSGAEAAALAIMIGGPKEAADAAMPLFEQMGKTLVHMGEAPEAGHALKCINNFLSATNLLAACEAMTLAANAGLDPLKSLEVINQATGYNSVTRDKWEKHMLSRNFGSGFTAGLMYKDLSMGCELAAGMGSTAFLLNHVRQMFGLLVSEKGPDADQTRLLEIIEGWAGKKERAPEEAS